MSTGQNWVTCPPGQWTLVSNMPVFAYLTVWSRSGSTIEVRYRRYQAGLPFFQEASATLRQGQNRWGPFTPDLINTWWFNYMINGADPTAPRNAVLSIT